MLPIPPEFKGLTTRCLLGVAAPNKCVNKEQVFSLLGTAVFLIESSCFLYWDQLFSLLDQCMAGGRSGSLLAIDAGWKVVIHPR